MASNRGIYRKRTALFAELIIQPLSNIHPTLVQHSSNLRTTLVLHSSNPRTTFVQRSYNFHPTSPSRALKRHDAIAKIRYIASKSLTLNAYNYQAKRPSKPSLLHPFTRTDRQHAPSKPRRLHPPPEQADEHASALRARRANMRPLTPAPPLLKHHIVTGLRFLQHGILGIGKAQLFLAQHDPPLVRFRVRVRHRDRRQ